MEWTYPYQFRNPAQACPETCPLDLVKVTALATTEMNRLIQHQLKGPFRQYAAID